MKDFLILVLSRAIIGDFLLVLGFSLTLGIKAIFLTKVEPYFILFWNWILLKEKVKPYHLFLLFIHLLGAITLSTGLRFGTIGGPQLGDLIIILAMASYAFSYFSAAKFTKTVGAVQTNMVMNATSGIIFLPFALFFSNSSIWHPQRGWFYIIIGALLFTAIGLSFWFAALRYVKNWMSSALRVIGPFVGAPIAFILFGQTLSRVQIIGGLVVLFTSFLIAREHKKSTIEEPE